MRRADRTTDRALTSPDPTAASDPAPPGYDRVSHGFAPESRAEAPPPVPLDAIVRDVLAKVSAAAQPERALLEARGSLPRHAIPWTWARRIVVARAMLATLLPAAICPQPEKE